MTRSELSKERERFIREKQKQYFTKIRAAQSALYSLLLENILSLSTDSGNNIKFNVGNINKGDKATLIVSQFNKTRNASIGNWLVNRFLDLFGLNRRYFKTIEPQRTKTVQEQAQRLIMRRLGYDVDKKELIQNGYIDTLVNSNDIGQRIGQRIQQAIAGNVSLSAFRDTLRSDFTDPDKLGLLEQHYYTKSFDIFQQTDRAIGKKLADDLGLKYAIYSGTIKNNTRPFCKDRVGKVFTSDEIDDWKDLNFQGKPNTGYVPNIDLGGFNCRHTLDYISKELAFRLRPELKDND